MEESTRVVKVDAQILGTKILIVDDDEQVIRGLKRTLKSTGWNILSVNSGPEAIAMLESTQNIAVILSDQNLPSSTGVELLAYAHKRFPNIVKVMITGGTDLSSAILAINHGHVFRYLTKPWEKDELIGALRAAVDLYETRQERDHYADEYRKQNEELEALNSDLEKQVQRRTQEVIKLFAQLEESFDATIEILLSILELSCPEVVQHSKRTSVRARHVARELGLGPEEVHTVERAGLLHWLGLTQVRSDFFATDLHMLGPDHEAEWEFHPILGSQALQSVPALDRERRIISNYLNPKSMPRDNLLAHILKACSCFEHAVNVRRKMGQPFSMRVLSDVLTVFENQYTDVAAEVIDVLFDMTADELAVESEQRSPSELKTGMVLAKDVASIEGIPVVPAGVRIDDELLERLQQAEVGGGVSVWKTEETK